MEGVDDRSATLLAHAPTLIGGLAADVGLHGIERRDGLRGLVSDRRRPGGGQLVEAPAHMRPAVGQADVALLGQRPLSSVAVHLQHAGKAGQMRCGALSLAIGRVDRDHNQRLMITPTKSSQPGAIIPEH